uniref:Radial spoke head 14 homolog n=1 Tax=Oryzias latipes TaxID=8090 RepID=A0A3P9J1E2_ORYLA
MSRDSDAPPAPVAFGRWAVPLLAEQLRLPGRDVRLRALAALIDVLSQPLRGPEGLTEGFLQQLKVLLEDEDPCVRAKVCQLLHVLAAHTCGRQALLAASFLPPLSKLLEDPPCKRTVFLLLSRLSLHSSGMTPHRTHPAGNCQSRSIIDKPPPIPHPAGRVSLLTLLPKLMNKLQEEEEEDEEVQVLLLSLLRCCFQADPQAALRSDAVALLAPKLSNGALNIRKAAAAAMMALSVPMGGKVEVSDQQVLPAVAALLQEEDEEAQLIATGVIMFAAVTTAGKLQCLHLNVLPVLLKLACYRHEDEDMRRRRKPLVLNSIRGLTMLAETPEGRRLLKEQLPLLRRTTEEEEDEDIQRVFETAIQVMTFTP